MKGNFHQLINQNTPVLVDFHADWCGPCKMQAPILKEVASDFKEQLKIIKIDVDKNNSIASRFKVQGVPTLILFKSGKSVWRQSGVVQKHQLSSVISRYL